MVDHFCTQGWNFALKMELDMLPGDKSTSQADRRLSFLSVPCSLFAVHLYSMLEHISRTGKICSWIVGRSLTRKVCPNLQAFLRGRESPWNYQRRFTVHGSRGGFSSVFLVEFHPSMQKVSTIELIYQLVEVPLALYLSPHFVLVEV